MIIPVLLIVTFLFDPSANRKELNRKAMDRIPEFRFASESDMLIVRKWAEQSELVEIYLDKVKTKNRALFVGEVLMLEKFK